MYKTLRNNSQSSINIWGPDSPQKAEMSQSNLHINNADMHSSIDNELLADWALAWDYTPVLDLTFLVFFECKCAHPTACSGLTPLWEKNKKQNHADPMLSDPSLPQRPLPTAFCCLSLFYIKDHLPVTHPVLIRHGKLHLCLSPDISTTSSACTKNCLLWRPRWLYPKPNDVIRFGPFCAIRGRGGIVTSVWASTDSLSTLHINMYFFYFFYFSTCPPSWLEN